MNVLLRVLGLVLTPLLLLFDKDTQRVGRASLDLRLNLSPGGGP